MFNRTTTIINPWGLAHHFEASAEYIDPETCFVSGGRICAGETEAELYLCIEQDNWESNPNHPGVIVCREILDGEVIRTWEIRSESYRKRIRLGLHAFPTNHPVVEELCRQVGCTIWTLEARYNAYPIVRSALRAILYPELVKEEVR